MRVATVVILALLAWVLPSAAAQAGVPEPASGAEASAAAHKRAGANQHRALKKRSSKRKRQLRKAVRKCRKIRKKHRRKRCVRKARKRFAKKPGKPQRPDKPKPGKTWRVVVGDTYESDYFSPDLLQIKAGDSIKWIWSNMNQNPHNVTLTSGPRGVNRLDYITPNSPSRNYSWKRRLEQPGTWTFACSLHHLMRMTVKVGK